MPEEQGRCLLNRKRYIQTQVFQIINGFRTIPSQLHALKVKLDKMRDPESGEEFQRNLAVSMARWGEMTSSVPGPS